jgi:hypothetical protein
VPPTQAFRHGHRVRFCVESGGSTTARSLCGDFAVAQMELDLPSGTSLSFRGSVADCSFLDCGDEPSWHCAGKIDGDGLVFDPFAPDCVGQTKPIVEGATVIRVERPASKPTARGGWWAKLNDDETTIFQHVFPNDVAAFVMRYPQWLTGRFEIQIGLVEHAPARVSACTRSAVALPICNGEPGRKAMCTWRDDDEPLRDKALFVSRQGCAMRAIAAR